MEYEEITFDMIAGNEQEKEQCGTHDNFGCCSKFRQCSDEGKCIQLDDYFKSCSYRKNLEQGRIFYGKKSPNFNQERYDYISKFYKSLAGAEKERFEEIVSYFVHVNRCSEAGLFMYSETLASVAQKCKIFEIASNDKLIRKLFQKGVILIKRAEAFMNKYSPCINFVVPSSLSHDKKLKMWEDFFIDNDCLNHEIAKRYIYIIFKNGQFELDEFFTDNFEKFNINLNNLKPLSAATLNDFKKMLE
ncbi:MAG: hypothetical protein NC203_00560 [Firmicutes bacterium]|nr:hypothetical protein [[Eubacterium] siraeum]MCM1486831.1 hypothetical protein [Bacillota bacterium]